MNNPIKQHYVPQAYLKNFSFDENGNVYTLKIKSSGKTKLPFETFPKERNVSSICYEKNIYTIKTNELQNALGVESKYHIEHKSFKYKID